MYLLLSLFSLFSQNSHTFLKNCYLIVVIFDKLTKNIMFDCSGVRFVPPPPRKKPNFQNGRKSLENRINVDILFVLAKPVDRHGITLVHMTYPPLETAKAAKT